jgi:Golgi phosphoprotein 3
MNKKVTEYFFVLALNADTGYYRVSGNYLSYGVLGAMLMDLALNDKIDLDGKFVRLKDASITGLPVYDKMLDSIRASSKSRTIKYWLRKFVFKASWYRKELQKLLVNNATLKQEQKRFIGIPYSIYFPANIPDTDRLVYRLKDILLYNKVAEEHELMFLGLAYACRMHRSMAKESQERRRIRKALVIYIKENPVASDVRKSIQEIHAAITASISAAVIASSSSGASN